LNGRAGGGKTSVGGASGGVALIAPPVEFPAIVEFAAPAPMRIGAGAPQFPQNRPDPTGWPQDVQNAP
jgi:hypothetical protein